MSDTLSWNLQLSVRDGRLDDARDLMPEMVEATRGEAGTLGYEWFPGRLQPLRVALIKSFR